LWRMWVYLAMVGLGEAGYEERLIQAVRRYGWTLQILFSTFIQPAGRSIARLRCGAW